LFIQLFLRDAKQCEAALGQQELYLSRQVEMPTADSVQEEIKKLEEFLKKMDTHDEKINHVMQFADQLHGNGHYAQDKVKKKEKTTFYFSEITVLDANDQLFSNLWYELPCLYSNSGRHIIFTLSYFEKHFRVCNLFPR